VVLFDDSCEHAGGSFDVGADSEEAGTLFVRIWRGQARLRTAFWIAGVAGALLLWGAEAFLWWQSDRLEARSWLHPELETRALREWLERLSYLLLPVIVVWQSYASVGIWRCAPRAESPAWRWVARGFVVLLLLAEVVAFVIGYGALRALG